MRLRIQSIRFEAETVRSFELRAPDGARLPPFTPGAHIDLALPGELKRSYSLLDDGEAPDHYRVAVHRDPASRGGSAYLCDGARVGETIEVDEPRNSFPLEEGASQSVLVAGGIGITPILAMARRLSRLDRRFQLHYAARSRAQAAFVAELAALRGCIHLHFDDEAGGVMNVAERLAGVDAAAHLYCCGPAPMLDAFDKATAGRAPDQVHTERFSGTAAVVDNAFTVVLKRSNRELRVDAGDTIMDTLLAAGIRVNHSCREGVCGTCETRVLDGVPDHKDNVLSARERASNKVMMICCSGAKGDRLVLDL